ATRVLILNPAMIRVKLNTWCEQCGLWIDKKVRSNNQPEHYYFKHKEKTIIEKADFIDIVRHNWTSAILDECHDQLANWKPSDINQERQGLKWIQPDVQIALTGTPIRGHEKKLFGTFEWLRQVRGGYWAWIETWFNVDKGGHGWEILGLNEQMEEGFHKSFDTICRRLTKKEVRPDLPDKDIQDVWVQLEGKHRRQYKEMLDRGEVRVQGGLVEAIGVLSEMTRLKQLAFGEWRLEGDKLVPVGNS